MIEPSTLEEIWESFNEMHFHVAPDAPELLVVKRAFVAGAYVILEGLMMQADQVAVLDFLARRREEVTQMAGDVL